MKEELDKKLVKVFPLLYSDRYASMQSTCMCWGFDCDSGWFDLIAELSAKLEVLIIKYIEENPDMCSCYHDRDTHDDGDRCQYIYKESAPNIDVFKCECNKFNIFHPKASQVKEKLGDLSFYMTSGTDEIFDLIYEYETKSAVTCEVCGEIGMLMATNNGIGNWYKTLCDACANSDTYKLQQYAKIK
ncbi:hypothetical protein CMI47_13100 [Candidatus Pacearchaeota archaeon]|nr:hypothetical protein [Candidatus Pacearchaeota archaeon]|tara:strand:+ start:20774 stop:21334 length:561 start_codon:yes stop_codon:yes gene_type:complete